jgi:transcriptional regulator with XRE-family HTH domain
MTPHDLHRARLEKGWSQVEAAKRLSVSQPYLAMLERGKRRLTPALVQRAVKVYDVSPTVLPPVQAKRRELPAATLARDLARLGYPGFAHLRSQRGQPKNPGEVLVAALAQDDLEPRLVEALPWLALRYSALDWGWVVPQAKVEDLQNRLGFVVGLARQLAQRSGDEDKASTLADVERTLENSRLAREDTLCRNSAPEPERRWLTEHRPEDARRWNLLTDWSAHALRYVN